jgi:hypothetical protein
MHYFRLAARTETGGGLFMSTAMKLRVPKNVGIFTDPVELVKIPSYAGRIFKVNDTKMTRMFRPQNCS